MSDGNRLIEQNGPSLIKDTGNNKFYTDIEGLYLFVSFDLVNSTAYKSQNSNWPDVFLHL
jgi:hypothetical protein